MIIFSSFAKFINGLTRLSAAVNQGSVNMSASSILSRINTFPRGTAIYNRPLNILACNAVSCIYV